MIGKFLDEPIWVYDGTAVASDFHFTTGCSASCTNRFLSSVPSSVSRVILNGDVVESAGEREAEEFLLDLNDEFDSVIYHKGNHEQMLKGVEYMIPDGIDFRDHTNLGDVVVTHGHRMPINMDLSSVEMIVVGHIHPLSDCLKSAIKAPFRYKTPLDTYVTVLPAFGNGISNIDYTDQNRNNPFIESVPDAEVVHKWSQSA